MISFFKKKATENFSYPITTDMHSHLLAGLDDGVKSHDEAILLLKLFSAHGYKKIITTPHIMSDYYRNSPETILPKLEELITLIKENDIDIEIKAAAEYYLDESLIAHVNNKQKLLTMGDNYILFETNFFTEPYQLNDFIFNLITQGYKPILAHPERYGYMSLEKAEELRDRGVLLQLNIPSLAGAYGKPVQKLAGKLIEKGWVDLVGTDCHNEHHFKILQDAFKEKYFKKALELPLLNHSL